MNLYRTNPLQTKRLRVWQEMSVTGGHRLRGPGCSQEFR